MKSSTTRIVAGMAGAVAGIAVAEQVTVRRLRGRRDPALDRLYRPPLDVTEHHIDTPDGGSLHVVERGEGRPLLLLHGVTLNANIWSPQFHQMAGGPGHQGFRVIAVDLRGHGQSTAGSAGFGLPVLAGDLAAVLAHLDLRDAIVAGHSMGGMTLMRFCGDQPESLDRHVAGLAFIATAAIAPIHPLVLERLKLLGAKAIDRLDAGTPYPQLKFSGNDVSLLLCRLAFGRAPTSAAVEQVRACIESMDDESFQRSWLGILDHDATEVLRSVALPAEVVVGSRDLLTPVSLGRTIADLLPDGHFDLLPGCGHQVMQERPAELGRILRRLDERISVA